VKRWPFTLDDFRFSEKRGESTAYDTGGGMGEGQSRGPLGVLHLLLPPTVS